MTQDETIPRDHLMRHIDMFHAERGLGPFDVYQRSQQPHIPRRYALIEGSKMKRYLVPPGHLLCAGAAVARCEDGFVRHVRPFHNMQNFAGFVVGMEVGDKVAVRSRGKVLLFIHGVNLNDVGRTVWALGPNEFTLSESKEGIPIGKVFQLESDKPGYCLVIFAGQGETMDWDSKTVKECV